MLLKPRVKETTQTTGFDDYQLLGAPFGYRTFLNAFGIDAECYYIVYDASGAYECGLGNISAASVLSRGIVTASSGGHTNGIPNTVGWAAGTKTVVCGMSPVICFNNGSQSFDDNATTPDVRHGHFFVASNSSSTTITNFAGGIDGQQLTILFANGNTTIQHNSNIKLVGGSNFVGTSNDTLVLVRINSIWYEVTRAVNA